MKCSDVTHDMAGVDCGRPDYEAEIGDLLWNPKAGEGHVIVAEVRCNSGDGIHREGRLVDCGCGGWSIHAPRHTTLVCECGQDGSWRDHHYYLLARA